jgi:hypothetical protein
LPSSFARCERELAPEGKHAKRHVIDKIPSIKTTQAKKLKKCHSNRDDDFLAAVGREYGDELAPKKALAPSSPNESPRDLPFFV